MTNKIILLLLVILAFGQINSQVLTGAILQNESIGDNNYKFYQTWDKSKFQDDVPQVAVSIARIIGSTTQYYDKPLDAKIIDIQIKKDSLTVIVHSDTKQYIQEIGLQYVAFDQGTKRRLAISPPIQHNATYNNDMVEVHGVPLSLNCPTNQVQIMPIVHGYNICSRLQSLYFERTNVNHQFDQETGEITGTHSYKYQIKCHNQDARNMTVAFIYGCEGNLEVQRHTGFGGHQEDKTPSLWFDKNAYNKEYRGSINALSYIKKDNQVGSLDFQGYQTEVRDDRIMFMNNARYLEPSKNFWGQVTQEYIKQSDFAFYNAMITIHGCDENCSNCSAGGYCGECKTGFVFDHSRNCVDPDYYTYYFVKGTNITKVVGEERDERPGTGYFVNMVTSCSYDLEYLTSLQEYQTDSRDEVWIWQTKSLQGVTETRKQLGYWVHDVTEDDWYWIPPAFDPENPMIRWDIWKWVLDWLLKDYTPETHDRQISEEDFTKKCVQQKWLYSSDEIAYVFNHIAKQDSDAEAISYNDVLRTLLQVEYGAYSRRILGDCDGISAQDIAISQGIAQKTQKVTYGDDSNQADSQDVD